MSAKDLVILAADKDMENALAGLLTRRESLGLRGIHADIHVNPEHDPGCAQRGVLVLSVLAQRYRHGLLIFDHQGSGREHISPQELQNQLNRELAAAWGERARAIVLVPELEAWVWSGSPHIAEVVGWRGRPLSIDDWLREQNLLQPGAVKPENPKKAFIEVLHAAQTPRSASLYRQIAEKVSLRRCQDAAFLELRSMLREWFPAE